MSTIKINNIPNDVIKRLSMKMPDGHCVYFTKKFLHIPDNWSSMPNALRKYATKYPESNIDLNLLILNTYERIEYAIAKTSWQMLLRQESKSAHRISIPVDAELLRVYLGELLIYASCDLSAANDDKLVRMLEECEYDMIYPFLASKGFPFESYVRLYLESARLNGAYDEVLSDMRYICENYGWLIPAEYSETSQDIQSFSGFAWTKSSRAQVQIRLMFHETTMVWI